MQGIKETAGNVGASAKAGMEKTKATMQEKVDKMTAHDPMQKEMATQKKEERKAQAELDKQEAREHNAAARQAARAGGDPLYATGGTGAYPAGTGTHTHSATGATGFPTGTQQMSAVPGHGTGQPFGGTVEEGMGRTHPSGMPGDTTGHNVRGGPGHGLGGTYS